MWVVQGATTYYYHDTHGGIHTQARKSWFFFDHEVVCLGAGITSGSPYDVMPTVNQDIDCKGSTFTYLADGKSHGLKEGDSISSASIKWVRHGDTGYIFPEGGRILIQRKMQQGNWYDINHAEKSRMEQKDIATVAIDHGLQPQNATYAYIVVPEVTSDRIMESYQDHRKVLILENTRNLQAVWHSELGIWQMIFHAKGQYRDSNIRIKVDAPCALMVSRKADGRVWLHIADPLQKEQIINLELKVDGDMKRTKKLSCNFTHMGEEAGKTKAFPLN